MKRLPQTLTAGSFPSAVQVPGGGCPPGEHSHTSPSEWLATGLWSGLALALVAALVLALILGARLARRRAARQLPCTGCGRYFDPARDAVCPACGRPADRDGPGVDA